MPSKVVSELVPGGSTAPAGFAAAAPGEGAGFSGLCLELASRSVSTPPVDGASGFRWSPVIDQPYPGPEVRGSPRRARREASFRPRAPDAPWGSAIGTPTFRMEATGIPWPNRSGSVDAHNRRTAEPDRH